MKYCTHRDWLTGSLKLFHDKRHTTEFLETSISLHHVISNRQNYNCEETLYIFVIYVKLGCSL
jgi:hypothetical protein